MNREPQHYVVGYAFRPDMGAVALIEKRKPAWQVGKLNGVGGKIEPGETPVEAMVREFKEEAGVWIEAMRWLHIRTERFNVTTETKSDQQEGTAVYHFAVLTTEDEWRSLYSVTREEVVKAPLPLELDAPLPLIYNMRYLVPMAVTLLQQPPENRPQP